MTADARCYPQKPFIRSSLRLPSDKVVNTLPECNRDGILSALNNLQRKIGQLELDRKTAETGLYRTSVPQHISLAPSTSKYSRTTPVHIVPPPSQAYTPLISIRREKDLETELKLERARSEALEKELRAGGEHAKLVALEREQIALASTQSACREKILSLERQLKLEKRRLREEDAEPKRPCVSKSEASVQASVISPRPRTRSRKKSHPPASSLDHYHLELRKLPFVAGQSITPSHHVGANVQNVLSLMKRHSPLCTSSHTHSAKQPHRSRRRVAGNIVRLREELSSEQLQLERQLNGLSAGGDALTRVELLEKLAAKRSQLRELSQLEGKVSRRETHTPRRAASASTPRIRTPDSARSSDCRTSRAGDSNADVLRSMRRLQTYLTHNDVSWQ